MRSPMQTGPRLPPLTLSGNQTPGTGERDAELTELGRTVEELKEIIRAVSAIRHRPA
jgi:hypothetical protein